MSDHETRSCRDSADQSFGPVRIIQPKLEHTHTVVMLHGRGSTCEEFAEELFASTLPDQRTLQDKLPGWRWVFPSSRELWSTAFQEPMPAWFEAHSLTDITARQELQVEGIKESVKYILSIVEDEIGRLDGNTEKLVLGGISQGAAIGMWALLCQQNPARRLGAFFGASTWLPFATNIERVFALQEPLDRRQGSEPGSMEMDSFVQTMMAPLLAHVRQRSSSLTPVLMGHGIDDAYVDIELGRQAAGVLLQIGLVVEWKEYSGAEEEGHWFKVPEQIDDILQFLLKVTTTQELSHS